MRQPVSSGRRFILALGIAGFLLAMGTFGYIFLEGWDLIDSLYMTFITISTVGFGEIQSLSREGRIFTMALIFLSLLLGGFVLTTLISFIFEGTLFRTFMEKRMKNNINRIKNHYILCGFGEVGKETSQELSRQKAPFVIVTSDVPDRILETYPDYLFIEGDATEETILEQAGIQRAKGLISCVSNDPQNVFIVLTARQINPGLHIVSRASGGQSIQKLEIAGANGVVSSSRIAGRYLATVSLRSSVANFLDALTFSDRGTLRIEALPIDEHSPLAGSSLRNSNLGKYTGAIIIGILNSQGELRINESPSANLSTIELQPGDELIATGSEEQLANLELITSGKTKKL